MAERTRRGWVAPRVWLILVAALVAAATDVSGARLGPEPEAASAASFARTTTTTSTTQFVAGRADPRQKTPGLLTFRGNSTRTFYGTGPLPTSKPRVRWTFPDRAMCRVSTSGTETKEWCGMGWTGQPAVFERDGRTWVVFGAYDGAVHFLDAETGRRILPDFQTGDLIKGSVTVDPDGYPLVYTGSRDGYYRVLSIDTGKAVERWRLAAGDVGPTMWNDDWDGSALVENDLLYEGGENSRFHIVRLNRSYDAHGNVSVDPEVIFHAAGWDDTLLRDLGDKNVSIETSVMKTGDTVWFTNSGGLVQAWDVRDVARGRTPLRVFRFWMGDDSDATIVADPDGGVYVSSEYERGGARSKSVGQLVRLDPDRADPVRWAIRDLRTPPSGFWATPALHRGLLYTVTNGGRQLAVDRATGRVVWRREMAGPLWQSPVVIDDVLVQGDCEGRLHAFDVSGGPVPPVELWTLPLGGCIEATPAVWKGRIYLGTRDGFIRAIW